MITLYISYRLVGKGNILIAGIGLDIVELDRIAKLDARSSKFRMRILTVEELKFTNCTPLIGERNSLRAVLLGKKRSLKRKEPELEGNVALWISDIA